MNQFSTAAESVASEMSGHERVAEKPVTRRLTDRQWLMPLLLLFVIKQLLMVFIIGPFTGHDEVDHFYYIARLAEGKGLGIVGEVDLPNAAKPYFAYVADPPHNAEVIQPPLYHLLLAPLYLALPSNTLAKLYVLRIVSVFIGLLVVVLAYLAARLLFPNDPLMRAGVPIFVSLQPQFSFEAAIVNHDILLIFFFSLLIYLLLRGLRNGLSSRDKVLIGLVTAAGLWTKTSFGFILPVTACALLLLWWPKRWRLRSLIVDGLLTIALPLGLTLPWFIRSYRLYGDPTGTAKLRDLFGDKAQHYSQMLWSAGFWRGRLEDFWGNYGWRLVPFDPWTYDVIYVIWAIAGLAIILLPVRALIGRFRHTSPMFSQLQRRGLFLLLLSFVLLVYGVLYVGTVQFTQSRFVFPAMIGIAVLSLIGIDRWLPERWRAVLVPVLFVAFVGLNVYVMLRFFIPFYYGPGGGAVLYP